MRTVQLAPLLAVGLVLGSLIVATPAFACGSIAAETTKCVTEIYNNQKNNVLGLVGGALPTVNGALATAQAQSAAALALANGQVAALDAARQAALAHAQACAPLLPGVPGVNWNPQPAIDGNLAYLAAQQGVAQGYAAQLAQTSQDNLPFLPTSQAIQGLYDNTVTVVNSWQSNVFDPLIVATAVSITATPLQDTVLGVTGDLPAFALGAGAMAQDMGGCLAATPLPSP
jgi:hypothetical protein